MNVAVPTRFRFRGRGSALALAVCAAGARGPERRVRRPSTVDTSVNPPVTAYTGPTRLPFDLPSVVDVVDTGDFESVLSWAIGLRSGAATVTAVVLTDPTRVVVDIPHVVANAVLAAPSFTG